MYEEGFIWLQIDDVLDKYEHHLRQCTTQYFLIQLKDTHPEDAKWEPTKFIHEFHHLRPWELL
jgi:hypothetical protein